VSVPTGSEAAKVRILTGPQFHAMRLANTGLCWMESTGAEPAYPLQPILSLPEKLPSDACRQNLDVPYADFGTPELENPPQKRWPLSPSPHFKIGDNCGHTDSNRRRGGKREQQLYTSWATTEVVHFQRLIDPA
jgi:hypothetical protein